MDHIWTPWRYRYVTQADKASRQGIPEALAPYFKEDRQCVFCNLLASVDAAIAGGMDRDAAERAGLLVARGEHNYVCLNLYPYTSGHLMVVPYAHEASLAGLAAEAAQEMMAMAQQAEWALKEIYNPDGYNFGLNLGKAAGAGVQNHLHMHAMPRWTGDTNFMTVVGETRVLPEDLAVTWERVCGVWGSC